MYAPRLGQAAGRARSRDCLAHTTGDGEPRRSTGRASAAPRARAEGPADGGGDALAPGAERRRGAEAHVRAPGAPALRPERTEVVLRFGGIWLDFLRRLWQLPRHVIVRLFRHGRPDTSTEDASSSRTR